MNLIEILNEYESLQEEMKHIENRASEYDREYNSLRNLGFNDQDFVTHEIGICRNYYENQIDIIENKLDKYYKMLYGEKMAKLLINEFKKVETKQLIEKIAYFYSIYTNRLIEIYQTKEGINIETNGNTKTYNIKDFYNWLIEDLKYWDLYDGEVTEELEFLINIYEPTYKNIKYY